MTILLVLAIPPLLMVMDSTVIVSELDPIFKDSTDSRYLTRSDIANVCERIYNKFSAVDGNLWSQPLNL